MYTSFQFCAQQCHVHNLKLSTREVFMPQKLVDATNQPPAVAKASLPACQCYERHSRDSYPIPFERTNILCSGKSPNIKVSCFLLIQPEVDLWAFLVAQQERIHLQAGAAETVGSIPGSERASAAGNGNSPQYSCLKNSRGAWWATVRVVVNSWT